MRIYWGDVGAGLALTCEDSILLTLRSLNVAEGHTWGIPGGAINTEEYLEADEGSEEKLSEKEIWHGALRETKEELGNLPPNLHPYDQVIFSDKKFKFITFFVEVPKEIKDSWIFHIDNRIDGEVDQAKWFKKTELPNWRDQHPLHFGVKFLLNRKPNYFTAK